MRYLSVHRFQSWRINNKWCCQRFLRCLTHVRAGAPSCKQGEPPSNEEVSRRQGGAISWIFAQQHQQAIVDARLQFAEDGLQLITTEQAGS
ncbi:hypothetical protein T07_12043 [Trichinella nelsoni]|uniref:Uncharacterized protein n=1 Tax=Trichinella nelsoni TaxID=6336 RepID=A0A0V0RVB7_9BILA|nr:hypothetical protein T07_12043 [Trichinella nelsoni]